MALSVLFEKTVSDEDFLKVFQAIDSEVLNTSIEAGEDIINAIPKIFEISGGKSASQDKKKFAFIGNILETLK